MGDDRRPLPYPRGTAGPLVPTSRRTVLVAGLAGVFAAAAFGSQTHADAGALRRAAEEPHPAEINRAVTTRPARTVAAHRPRPWRGPVRRLDDFRRHVPGTRFAPRAVMLTLDDGPSAVWTPRFLDLLERHHVVATFFMIGSQVPRDRGLVREVVARGHAVGNHTWTHDEELGRRPHAQIVSEIDRTNHAIHSACGRMPTQFRAPGGFWTPALLEVLAERRLVPVGWDVDPSDWARPGVAAIEHSLRGVRPHDIALCHDGGGDRRQTYVALRSTLPVLLQRGYTFTTLPSA